MALTYKEVAEILKIIDASDCEEVVLELEGTRLVVRRGGASGATSPASLPTVAPATGPSMAAPPAAASSVGVTPSTSLAPAAEAGADQTTVRSPMVGTFYRRPSPDDPWFVEEGSVIKPGDALCLIEVMKLYTTIEATTGGTIKAILAEDGSLVEFDQPLFIVRPT